MTKAARRASFDHVRGGSVFNSLLIAWTTFSQSHGSRRSNPARDRSSRSFDRGRRSMFETKTGASAAVKRGSPWVSVSATILTTSSTVVLGRTSSLSYR